MCHLPSCPSFFLQEMLKRCSRDSLRSASCLASARLNHNGRPPDYKSLTAGDQQAGHPRRMKGVCVGTQYDGCMSDRLIERLQAPITQCSLSDMPRGCCLPSYLGLQPRSIGFQSTQARSRFVVWCGLFLPQKGLDIVASHASQSRRAWLGAYFQETSTRKCVAII